MKGWKKQQKNPRKSTLSPIIMEVENDPKWKETNIRGTHLPLPLLWDEGYVKVPGLDSGRCLFT